MWFASPAGARSSQQWLVTAVSLHACMLFISMLKTFAISFINILRKSQLAPWGSLHLNQGHPQIEDVVPPAHTSTSLSVWKPCRQIFVREPRPGRFPCVVMVSCMHHQHFIHVGLIVMIVLLLLLNHSYCIIICCSIKACN